MDGKVVLVTGAARGIGNNIAKSFVNAGATVVIADIDNKLGAEAAEQLNKSGSATFAYSDLSTAAGADATIQEVLKQHGSLHVLINNARSGPNGRRDLSTEDEESWDATMAVTLKGTFFCSTCSVASLVRISD